MSQIMMGAHDLLFVYGTLRRGGSHHRLLGDAEHLGAWRSGPHYRMLDMGPYPALVQGEATVAGEIYRIRPEMLPMLDAYEGCPGDYRRERIDTEFGMAWVYLWDRVAPTAAAIPGGDWLRHLARR